MSNVRELVNIQRFNYASLISNLFSCTVLYYYTFQADFFIHLLGLKAGYVSSNQPLMVQPVIPGYVGPH